MVGGDAAPPAPPRPRPPAALIVILAAALLFGAAFASAPWFAFRALRDAALNADQAALSELVDFNAVRADLRTRLADEPAPSNAPMWQDPMGALRRAIEPLRPAPPIVDRYLSPEGLADLTRGYTPGQAPADARAPLPRYRYWDLRRARLAVPGSGGDTVFTFRRERLFGWRLVAIAPPAAPK